MPLLEPDEHEVKKRIFNMFMDTIQTFRLLAEHAEEYFGENSTQLKEAINEYIQDFIDQPDGKERIHPEELIFKTSRVDLQNEGFYGAQLNLKERQVTEANRTLRKTIIDKVKGTFNSPFKKWVSRINNFLASLGITGVGNALKEIKDCLKDELPDD